MKNVPVRTLSRKLDSPSAAVEVDLLRKTLGQTAIKRPIKDWLDTSNPDLNGVFGSRELGIPFGRMVELSGFQSHGKTALALELMAIAQKQGAYCIWIDIERSWDDEWSRLRGVDPDNVYVIAAEPTQFKGERDERLPTAEEMCDLAEKLIKQLRKKYGDNVKLFVGVDSVAGMLTEMEIEAGLTDQNMRTNMSLPAFMSKLTRRWVAFAGAYNVLFFFINQIRTKPGVAFGNPEYQPGGNGLPFYAAVRVSMRRVKGGIVMQNGVQVGIQGTLTNMKNKAGGGSRERAKIGFKILFTKPSKFFHVKELTDERPNKKGKDNVEETD